MDMRFRFRFPALLLVVLVSVVLTGCRTYGARDSVRFSYEQILETNRVFAGELQRAERDEATLMQRAATDQALWGLDQEYSALVDRHRRLLAEHRSFAQRLEGSRSHRDVSRTLQAIVVDQQMMRDAYDRFFRQRIEVPAIPEVPLAMGYFEESRYTVVPPFYERLRRAVEPSSVAMLTQAPDFLQAPEPETEQVAPAPEAAPEAETEQDVADPSPAEPAS
jgi:hypothetical protein